MIPRAMHRSAEYLSYETIDEGDATSHCLKWGPLPPNEVVGSYSTPGRQEEGQNERTVLSKLEASL